MVDEATERYSGIEILEVMKEAVNYNRFLMGMVSRFARPGAQILDFGAGAGTFAQPMQALGMTVTCVEPDRVLREHLQSLSLDARETLGQIPDQSIDYIYSLNVLEHIEDDVGTLRTLQKKLKPGGLMVLYVPAFQLLYSSVDREICHFRRYRRSNLVQMVRDAGLSVTKSEYVDVLGFFAALLYKLLDDGSGTVNIGAIRLFDRVAFPISRALDFLFRPFLGKNVLIIARRE